MKPKISAWIDRKGLRKVIGVLLVAAPFLLLAAVVKPGDVKQVLTRPYWENALAERAKTVPRPPGPQVSPAEAAEGTLDGLPRYDLFIKPNTLAALQALLPVKKEHEPNLGFLPESSRVYQPAFFEYRGRKWKVDIRFRGDSAFHWMGRKQSWRIKFPRRDLFDGMRRIDLINPKSANCVSDYLTMWLATKMGLMAPEIKFVNLVLNNRRMGVYQETELIDKTFLQKRGRSVGNIYGEKDKKPKWYFEYPIYTDVVFWRKHCADPMEAPDDYTEMARLLDILNNTPDGEFRERIFTVLDREKFYRWNCHALLCSSGHQDWFHNARLYYDPAREAFEFIPWDLSGFWQARGFFFDTPVMLHGRLQENPLSSRILRQGPFRLERDRMLWGYLKTDGFMNAFLAEADRIAATVRPSVYKDTLKESIGSDLRREEFTNEQFEGVLDGLKYTTSITCARIRDALQFGDLKADIRVLREGATAGGVAVARVGLVNSASSAAAMRAIQFPSGGGDVPAEGAAARCALYEDTDSNGLFDAADRRLAPFAWDGKTEAFRCGGLECLVYPDLNGELQPVSTRKNFFVVREGDGAAPPLSFGEMMIEAENAVTGEGIPVSVQLVDERRQGIESLFQ